jgi:hypothetical protein
VILLADTHPDVAANLVAIGDDRPRKESLLYFDRLDPRPSMLHGNVSRDPNSFRFAKHHKSPPSHNSGADPVEAVNRTAGCSRATQSFDEQSSHANVIAVDDRERDTFPNSTP